MNRQKRKVVRARSAGVIVIHPADLAVSERHYLLLKHRHGAHWGFPKGTVEPNESDWQTAVRELEEETGLTQIIPIPGFEREIHYQFKRDQLLIDKAVKYFMAATKHQRVTVSEEHTDYGWFSYLEACTRMTHQISRDLLEQTELFLAHFVNAQNES